MNFNRPLTFPDQTGNLSQVIVNYVHLLCIIKYQQRDDDDVLNWIAQDMI